MNAVYAERDALGVAQFFELSECFLQGLREELAYDFPCLLMQTS